MGIHRPDQEGDVLTVEKTKTKPPTLYRVLLHNDDYTPMEFVVMIVEAIFNKRHEDAIEIMLNVHKRGIGVCGVYTFEVAETKVIKVIDIARGHGHPLMCSMEPE